MQDMAAAMAGAGATPPGGGADGGKVAGAGSMARLGIAAQLYARESGCKCKACDLLRQMVELMVGDLLKVSAEHAGSPDSPAG